MRKVALNKKIKINLYNDKPMKRFMEKTGIILFALLFASAIVYLVYYLFGLYVTIGYVVFNIIVLVWSIYEIMHAKISD